MAHQDDEATYNLLKTLRNSYIKAHKPNQSQIAAQRNLLIQNTNRDTLDLTYKQGGYANVESLRDEDMKNLAQALKTNTTTTMLNLQGNNAITEKSAAVLLKALEKNMTLKTVNLDDCPKLSPKAKANFKRKLEAKFTPKTPGLFTRIWQSIFSKPNAEGAGGVLDAALNNGDPFHQGRLAAQEDQRAAEVPPQLANPMAVILPPGAAPEVAKSDYTKNPEAPPPIPPIQKALDQLVKANIDIPDNNENNNFRDPITLAIMVDPVIAADGGTYERESIKDFFASGGKISPLDANREKTFANQDLKPNAIMQDKILNYLESLKSENQNPPPRP